LPHHGERSGALVAAFGAILVIIQLLDEIKFEEQRSKILDLAEQEMETNTTQLIGSEEVGSVYGKKHIGLALIRSGEDALARRLLQRCAFFWRGCAWVRRPYGSN
jgi:hypothetical protein